ncbi:MAG: DUF4920 domain-containing protein [Bacteroidetes bacterium]|nr:DUF4920 domain-containing protein [Bacteroidota bacterium]
MKKLLALLTIVTLFTACENSQEKNASQESTETTSQKNPNAFGKEIIMEKVADCRRLPGLLDTTTSVEIKLIGSIADVCQASGCWLDLDMGDNQYIHVTFKDEAFVVPKDIADKTAIIEGVGTKELVSVDMLKKAAKSEGLSQKEIDAIQFPTTEYNFEAVGVTIK